MNINLWKISFPSEFSLSSSFFLFPLIPHPYVLSLIFRQKIRENFSRLHGQRKALGFSSLLLMKWNDSSGVLTLNTGIIQAYFKSHDSISGEWDHTCRGFVAFIHALQSWSYCPWLPWSVSLSFFVQVLPVRSQFTSSWINPSWLFLSSVAPTHNNNSSSNSYNYHNNINNTRVHFLKFYCVPGSVRRALLFHLTLMQI